MKPYIGMRAIYRLRDGEDRPALVTKVTTIPGKTIPAEIDPADPEGKKILTPAQVIPESYKANLVVFHDAGDGSDAVTRVGFALYGTNTGQWRSA